MQFGAAAGSGGVASCRTMCTLGQWPGGGRVLMEGIQRELKENTGREEDIRSGDSTIHWLNNMFQKRFLYQTNINYY